MRSLECGKCHVNPQWIAIFVKVPTDMARPGEHAAATPPLLKDMNERTVLEAIRAGAPISRAELSRRIGISKPTVSLALQSLVDSGLVRQAEHRPDGPSYGATFFEPVADAALALGLDLGGRFLRGAICDLRGATRARQDVDITGADAAGVLEVIAGLRDALVESTGLSVDRVDRVVVGVPGVVRSRSERIDLATSVPGLEGPSFGETLRARLGIPVTLENDVNLAALGEQWQGVARGVEDFVFLSIGTGMGAGLVLSLAASPPIAAKFNLEPFYFVRRQAALLLPAIVIMFAASTLTPKQIRRASLIIFVVGIALMAATMFVGPEIKGAKRWLQVGFFSIQPSEFVKPAFVVLTAWLFNESQKRSDVPGIELGLALYGIFALMLVLQPDFGQTLLVTIVWITLFFMAGISLFWIGALGLAGLAGIASAYFLVPHVASRIDRFLNPASGDTYQADKALDSFLHGGWFGRGPGEGTVKDVLPDSHTDFIFAVAAEEYGLIACLILLLLFAFIVLRGLSKASQEQDGFIRYATAGLIMLFGIQTLINMAVNVGLLPAKGMTLPFISYGGSSMISLAYAMGMLLALTREQPRAAFLTAPEPELAGSAA